MNLKGKQKNGPKNVLQMSKEENTNLFLRVGPHQDPLKTEVFSKQNIRKKQNFVLKLDVIIEDVE